MIFYITYYPRHCEGAAMASDDQFRELIDRLEHATEKGCALGPESAMLLLTALEGTLEAQSAALDAAREHRFRLEMSGGSGGGFEELLGLADDENIARAMFRHAASIWPDRRIVLFDKGQIVERSPDELER
jgi:hypothetical protein